jgi:hypothetical protein
MLSDFCKRRFATSRKGFEFHPLDERSEVMHPMFRQMRIVHASRTFHDYRFIEVRVPHRLVILANPSSSLHHGGRRAVPVDVAAPAASSAR